MPKLSYKKRPKIAKMTLIFDYDTFFTQQTLGCVWKNRTQPQTQLAFAFSKFYNKGRTIWVSTLWFQFVFQTSSMHFETPYHVEKEIQFLVTKRGWTWKRISFLKSLNVNFLAMLWFSITWNQFWRIQREKQWKYIFLWYFMKKIRKTRKYRFWLQKVVKIWIWQYFIDGQSSNCVSLHFSIIFGHFFFHGQKSWFWRTFRRIWRGMHINFS